MKKVLVGCLAVALLLVTLVVAGIYWMLRTTPALEARLTLPFEVDVCNPTQDYTSLFADIIVRPTVAAGPPGASSP
jgi:hypothetical protein